MCVDMCVVVYESEYVCEYVYVRMCGCGYVCACVCIWICVRVLCMDV